MRVGSDARAIALVMLLALTRVAGADSRTIAEQTFDRGRELMKQQKFVEACAAFEQSHRLDPQLGTLFNLADCEVELGKLATAWNRYRELARADPNPDRRAMSAQLAESLAPRVPKLVVQILPMPDGASVAIDGRDSTHLVGVETPIDLGSHEVVVSAPGYQTKRKTIEIEREGQVVETVIKVKRATSEDAAVRDGTPASGGREPVDPVTSSPRATYAKAALIGGGVLVAAGLVAGGLAYAKWDEAQHCEGCDRPATSRRALLFGNVSTALVVGGALPIAVGLYLWKTSSSSAAVTARLDGSRAQLALTTTF